MNLPAGVLRLLTIAYTVIVASLVLLHARCLFYENAFSHWPQLLVLL